MSGSTKRRHIQFCESVTFFLGEQRYANVYRLPAAIGQTLILSGFLEKWSGRPVDSRFLSKMRGCRIFFQFDAQAHEILQAAWIFHSPFSVLHRMPRCEVTRVACDSGARGAIARLPVVAEAKVRGMGSGTLNSGPFRTPKLPCACQRMH